MKVFTYYLPNWRRQKQQLHGTHLVSPAPSWPDNQLWVLVFSLTICPFSVCVHAKTFRLCLTLSKPVDCSPPGSSVHRILQARILERVAILCHIPPYSRGSSQPRDQTHVFCGFCTAGKFFTTELPGKPHLFSAMSVRIPTAHREKLTESKTHMEMQKT